MKPILEPRGRANTPRRRGYYRLHLEVMEQRLPPGDAFFGALVGSWWLGASSFMNPAPRMPEMATTRSASATDVSQILLATDSSEHSWQEPRSTHSAVQARQGTDSGTRSADRQRDAREAPRPADSLALDGFGERPTTAGHAVQLAEAVHRGAASSDGLATSGTAGLMSRPALTTPAAIAASPQGFPQSNSVASVAGPIDARPQPVAPSAPAPASAGQSTARASTSPATSLQPSVLLPRPSIATASTLTSADISGSIPNPPAPPPPDSSLLHGFVGLNSGDTNCNCQPPDTNGAVGPNTFIESVNTALAIYNKDTGARAQKMEFVQFFTSLGGELEFSDPVVTYDEISQKFVVAILDFNTFNQCRLDVAISNDSNPTLNPSDWTFRRYDTNDHVPTSFDFSDYPKVGYNADGWVYSFNMFPNFGGYDHVTTLSIRKSDLTGFLNVVPGGNTNFTFAPATMHDSSPGDPMWFVEDGTLGGDNNVLHVVMMANPFSAAPTFTNTTIPVSSYTRPPRAVQPSGGTIDTIDARFYFSASRTVGGVTHLVAAHTVGTAGIARARWYDLDISSAAPTLIQEGEINQGTGVYTFFPSLDISASGYIGMTFSQSSATAPGGYWSMYVAGRTPADALGTVETPLLAKQGERSSPDFRAGDYSFVSIDPTDGTFWAANEYPPSNVEWGTWIANFRVAIPAGPSVTSTTPSGNTFGTISSVRVSFDEEINPDTFTTDKVLFENPGGSPILVTDVEPVAGSGNRQFDVSFASQTALGPYTIVVGPDIEDTNGNPMDQNHNGIPGEVPGDEYVARITLQGPKIIASTPVFGTVLTPQAVSSVRVTFNEPMNPDTFTPDKVASFIGPRGNISVTAVAPVAGSNNTQFDIRFAPQAFTGYYTLVVGPNIQDPAGHAMDQNGNFIPGEIPGDQFIERFGIQGPRITTNPQLGSFLPNQTRSVRVAFNEPMNPTTFTPDAVTLVGPDGPVTITAVTPVSGTNNAQFDIQFAFLTTAGLYNLVVSPHVRDAFGNEMDQNGNLIPGEDPGDQYTAILGVQGPRITDHSLFGGIAPQRISSLQVTFNESMDPTTFTPDKIAGFTRTNGTVVTDLLSTITTIAPVTGSNNTRFNINFQSTGATGRYILLIGPDIEDTFGNEMDQNQNSIPGEVPGDEYTATFTILGPKITASTPSGSTLPQRISSVQVTFNEPMDPTTFTPDQVASFTRTNGTDVTDLLSTITTVVPVGGSNNTRFNINFEATALTGQYALTVGPDISDMFGNTMDQNNNLILGEVPGDEYTATFALQGPRVNSSTPSGVIAPPQLVSSVQVTFNEPMDPTTFTPDQVVSFTRTNGTDVTDLLSTITTVVPVTGSNNTRFNVNFEATALTGQYALTIGPDISDTFGNAMDQNGNLVTGEVPGDEYTATFSIAGPKITASTPSGSILPQLVSSVQVTFNEPMDPATFSPDKIASFTRTNGANVTDLLSTITTVVPVAGSNNTRFNINFQATGMTGMYALTVGPDIHDTFGNAMDQNVNFITGEVPGDQYTATFTLVGPRITSSSPMNNVLGQVNSVRVVFNEPMDPTTFTPDKISSFTGPDGPIDVTGVFIAGSSTQFDITFAPQVKTGRYTMVIGPDIEDFFGNAMDQNGNLIPGEVPGDQYTNMFGIQGPRITNSGVTGTLPGQIQSVRVTFNEAMDRATFNPDKIASFKGPGGIDLSVSDVQPVPLTGDTQFDIFFDPLTVAGNYTMVIGPDIRDLYGNAMDQNQNLIPGEIPGDQYTATFTVAGPVIVASNPANNNSGLGPIDHVQVTFNEPMNASTFTPEQVTSFTGPSGDPIPVTDVQEVPSTNHTQFNILFDSQEDVGRYTMVIGPGIEDSYGNPMSQSFTLTFNLISSTIGPDGFGHVATVAPFEDLEIFGQPDTFNILGPGWVLNQSVPVDLGSNTFTFYGHVYTGNNQLFVSSNALITFGSAFNDFRATDLTSSPSQAAIAAVWFPWRRGRDNPRTQEPLVVGQFADIDDAGVPHQLIIEWNQAEVVNSGKHPYNPATFQVILSLNTGADESDVVINYPNLHTAGPADEGTGATVGIKASGTQGANRLLVNFQGHSPFVGTGQAIRFTVASASPRDSVDRAWSYPPSNLDGFGIERSGAGIRVTAIATTAPDVTTLPGTALSAGGVVPARSEVARIDAFFATTPEVGRQLPFSRAKAVPPGTHTGTDLFLSDLLGGDGRAR